MRIPRFASSTTIPLLCQFLSRYRIGPLHPLHGPLIKEGLPICNASIKWYNSINNHLFWSLFDTILAIYITLRISWITYPEWFITIQWVILEFPDFRTSFAYCIGSYPFHTYTLAMQQICVCPPIILRFCKGKHADQSGSGIHGKGSVCLLYTSDAADD